MVIINNHSLSVLAASQSVKKIIEINPYMLGTMAGGAADCQFWHRNLGIKVAMKYYVFFSGFLHFSIWRRVCSRHAIRIDIETTKYSGVLGWDRNEDQ